MNWATIAVNLPEELAGQLFIAICAMQTGKDYEIKDPAIKAIFTSIEEKMNEDAANWKKTCERKSEAGKKGSEARASKTKHEPSTAKQDQARAKHEPSTAKQDQADNENVNVTDNSVKENKQRKAAASAYVENQDLNDAILSFIEHRKKMRKPMTDKAISLFIDRLNKLGNTPEAQIDLINTAILKGWQTVYPPNENARSGTTKSIGFTGFESQRKYDFNNLEQKLLAK